MKKLNVILLAGIVALSSAVVGQAQITQGSQEVSFSGSYFHGTRGESGNRFWHLNGTYGYFVTPQIEVLGIASLNGSRGGSTSGHIGIGADYHFMMQGNPNFVPFAGAAYLVGVGSHRETDGFGTTVRRSTEDLLEIHGGVKQFVTRNVAIKYQVGYGFDPSDTSDAGFRATIGLSYFF